MSYTVLVLHGPNLPWLGQDDVDARLEARARALGAALDVVQANGEAGLIDALLEREGDYDAVLVNPGALAPTAWALAEALTLAKVPAVEVLLAKLPAARGASALAGAVTQQVHGLGHEGYLRALEALAGSRPSSAGDDDDEAEPSARVEARAGKSIGRKGTAPPVVASRVEKRLGRGTAAAPVEKRVGGKSVGRKSAREPVESAAGLTRAKVREQLASRLARRQSPEALAAWARSEWSTLHAGGACEEGARELLDGVLLTLMAGSRASEDVLLAQLGKLS
jgi:3-dehydroquinate dehydratase-2